MTMERQKQLSPEERTAAFFDRPAAEVVRELSEAVYRPDAKKEDYLAGDPKILTFSKSEQERKFKITLAQAYSEGDAMKVWKGSRLQTIKDLPSGNVIAFKYRAATLSFIKTTSGENVLLRELENVETGEKTKSPTDVSATLGLVPGDQGSLLYTDQGELSFQKKQAK